MTKRYNLSSDQQAQIKPILANQQQQMQALRQDSSLSREDKMAKVKSIRLDSSTEVAVGEPVTVEMQATVPPGAGTIVAAEWDFDGQGQFPFSHGGIDGTARSQTFRTTHVFDRPGEYFVTGRVHSHRQGDLTATSRRIPNVAQARVIVR